MIVTLLAEVSIDTETLGYTYAEFKPILEKAATSTNLPTTSGPRQWKLFAELLGKNIESIELDYSSGRMQ